MAVLLDSGFWHLVINRSCFSCLHQLTHHRPLNGEIDIIEGVNQLTRNKASLHSGDTTCAIQSAPMLGSIASTDCQTTHNGQMDNFVGCGIDLESTASFGDPFNNGDGGVYAMQWTDDFIKTWFFPRGSEPKSLSSGCSAPDLTEFGTPDTFFSGCDIGSNFKENRLMFTTTFCGSWAGDANVYPQSCPLIRSDAGQSCRAQVALNPDDYQDRYAQPRRKGMNRSPKPFLESNFESLSRDRDSKISGALIMKAGRRFRDSISTKRYGCHQRILRFGLRVVCSTPPIHNDIWMTLLTFTQFLGDQLYQGLL